MNFVLAVDDVVEVPVKLSLKNKGVHRTFAFDLTCSRLAQDDINTRLEDKSGKVADFLKDVVTDWKGQKLVLTQDGTPAEFSSEALDAMLNVAGVATVCFSAYFKECGAKEKN